MLLFPRIILNRPKHPGNIGSAARAMKTMGFTELVLVSPCEFSADQGMAKAMAAGAEDIVRTARVVDSLDDALGECQLLLGTSARSRGVQWPLLNPRQAAEKILEKTIEGVQPIAVLFGSEDCGLLNTELQRCQYHIHIPANPEYSSLNLGAAVQILAYEIRTTLLAAENNKQNNIEDALGKPVLTQKPTAFEMEYFFTHFEEVLYQVRFIDPKQPKKILQRLRRIYTKAQLDSVELNMLRGILKEIQRTIGAVSSHKPGALNAISTSSKK